MLIGRQAESARLEALLEDARRGLSGALAVIGDPGLGKTALLDEARERSADMRPLTATGVESESELPFASLHELLGPLLELLPRIPTTQARALAAALSLEDGVADVLAVSAGTLSLIVEAAEETPLLLLLDDAHWFDHASAQALAFATRRLRAEQIAVLAACRPGTARAFEQLPRIDLRPLGQEDARALVRTRSSPLSPADETRVLDAAGGNPLVLLELPVELALDVPSSPTTQHERLERTFAGRVNDLPKSARSALLLAAAEPDAQTVRAAVKARGRTDPLAAAEAAGLIHIEDGIVVFRHPVVRSLVYSGASGSERTTAHRALADVLVEDSERDRRAWHLGVAAGRADEEVAALLEQTADRAMARGGYAAASRALERAARLSPDPEDRARRLHAAAQSERHGGSGVAKARALTEEALSLAAEPLLRFDLLLDLRTMSEWTDARESESALLAALDDPHLDDERRVQVLVLAMNRRLDSFDAAGAVALSPELERRAANAGSNRGARARVTAGLAHLLAGDRDEATRCFRAPDPHPDQATMAAFDYMSLEWHDELQTSLAATFADALQTGNLHRIMWNRSCAAHFELRHGRLRAAAAAAAEALRVGELLEDPKTPIACAALAGVHAWRGEVDQCRANARRAAASARSAHDLFMEGLAQGALALLALGTGRPADAIAELTPLTRVWRQSTVRDPAATPFIPDLVEALALDGNTDEARALLAEFAPLASAAGNVWMLAACARCDGLLASGEEFDEPFTRAVELLEPSPYVLDLARTRLGYGERLRRAGRPREARIQLQAAHEAFAAAGATAWQKRTAAELRATGVHVSGESAPLVDLTPQELAIATLIAQGRSNKEVATAVYLSPKTVEYHLSNTFRKLNIHSRVELARLMLLPDGD